MLAADATLLRHRSHWFVRETIGMLRRTLARLDVTVAHAVRPDRAAIVLRRHAPRAGARRRSQLHARAARRRGGGAEGHAVHAQLRRVSDGERSRAPRRPLLRRRGADRARERRRRPRACRGRGAGARPRHRRAGRARLGRRGARRAGGACEPVAGRADRHGGQSALRRPRDDGDADLRPAVRLAELDLHPPQRGRRGRCAEGLRHRQQAPFQLGRV